MDYRFYLYANSLYIHNLAFYHKLNVFQHTQYPVNSVFSYLCGEIYGMSADEYEESNESFNTAIAPGIIRTVFCVFDESRILNRHTCNEGPHAKILWSGCSIVSPLNKL